MTSNTFHFAGVASKSNVTRGVPRIEEILSLTENPKKPATTIRLKHQDEEFIEKAQEIKHLLEYTNLRDIVTKVSIHFDPNPNSTNINEDLDLVNHLKNLKILFQKVSKVMKLKLHHLSGLFVLNYLEILC